MRDCDPPVFLPALDGAAVGMAPPQNFGLRILLICTNSLLREAINLVLSYHGYPVVETDSAERAFELIHDAKVGLVLIGQEPAGSSTYNACRKLRQHTSVPIIVIGDSDEEILATAARYAGADEYLVRPLSASQIVDRVHRLLHMRGRMAEEPTPQEIVLDVQRRRVLCRGTVIDLSMREFQLFETLALNEGVAMSRESLIDRVWGIDALDLELRTVDATVARIRRKLKSVGQVDTIETVAGIGYRLGLHIARVDNATFV